MKLKKLLGLALSGVLTISAIGCSKTQPENIDEKGNNKIVIGASAVPHAEILEEVKPKVAVISVGKTNRYGHPHQEILKRLIFWHLMNLINYVMMLV